MKKYTTVFKVLLVAFLAVGCAKREHMQIPGTVLDQKPKIAITQISGFESGQLYKQGDQGLFDIAINNLMTASLNDRLKSLDTRNIVENEYYVPFEKTLSQRSAQVFRFESPLDREKLGKHPENDLAYAHYDFTALKDQFKTDYVLVLEPVAFGGIRSYYGFIPLSAPRGYTHLCVYLVKLEDNSIAGFYDTLVEIPVHGDWDTPPDFSNLVQAAGTSLTRALQDANEHFFPTKQLFR